MKYIRYYDWFKIEINKKAVARLFWNHPATTKYIETLNYIQK